MRGEVYQEKRKNTISFLILNNSVWPEEKAHTQMPTQTSIHEGKKIMLNLTGYLEIMGSQEEKVKTDAK